jgi:hypothetical protein
MSKNIKKSILKAGVLAAVGVLALPLATYAVSNEVEVDATVGASISISAVTSSGATPVDGTPSLATVAITTATNADSYTLSFQDGDTNTSLVGPTESIPSLTSAGTITGTSSVWGYYVGTSAPVIAGTNFNPIPSSASAPVSVTTNGAKGSSTQSVWFGVNVASNLGDGVYKDTLVFTAVANF